jgi:hypothetical protein
VCAVHDRDDARLARAPAELLDGKADPLLEVMWLR